MQQWGPPKSQPFFFCCLPKLQLIFSKFHSFPKTSILLILLSHISKKTKSCFHFHCFSRFKSFLFSLLLVMDCMFLKTRKCFPWLRFNGSIILGLQLQVASLIIQFKRSDQYLPDQGDTNGIPHESGTEKGATILEMKHRDYCSGPVTDWNKKLQKRLISDENRVRSFQTRIKKHVSKKSTDVSKTQIPLTSGIKLQTLNYIVTVELSGRKMAVIVDTGSDLTWVQCEPCRSCYNQQDPLFNPSISDSYQKVLCNSTTCQSLQFATGNPGFCGQDPPTCNYDVSYGDGSFTRGELGSENLNLGPTVVKNFIFGCGRNNKGLFGGASGLMGLGRSDLSLVSQTKATFGGVFSYCLPSTENDGVGSFILGNDESVYKNTTPISYTRMLPNPSLNNFFFLNLTGFSIGGVGLQVSNFAPGGIIIDSGTVITRLAPSVYKALKSEFIKQFSGFPSVPGFSILDTCFNLSGYEEVNIPTLKMSFDGDIEVTIDVSGVFYFVKTDASQVCLALASLSYDDQIGIIGNFQQKNLRVIYDTKESKMGFADETCGFL